MDTQQPDDAPRASDDLLQEFVAECIEALGAGGEAGLSACLKRRPELAAAARAQLEGGVHEVTFGKQKLRDAHGQVRLETPGASSAPDRWEIQIEGGLRAFRLQQA